MVQSVSSNSVPPPVPPSLPAIHRHRRWSASGVSCFADVGIRNEIAGPAVLQTSENTGLMLAPPLWAIPRPLTKVVWAMWGSTGSRPGQV